MERETPKEAPKEERQRWPVVVRTDPSPGFEDVVTEETRHRCADCALFRTVAGLHGWIDNGRCTGTRDIYHPVPDLLRHCPFNQFTPRNP